MVPVGICRLPLPDLTSSLLSPLRDLMEDQLGGGGGGGGGHQPHQQAPPPTAAVRRRSGMEPENPQLQVHQQNPPHLPCPRCQSNHTKFCYYNNYSLSQPRYFCKGCRRYWTHGGTLRNVPVGGGCRKSKRPKLADDQKPKQNIVNAAAHDRCSTINIAVGSNLGLVSNVMISSSSSTALAPPPAIGSLYPGYGGGGFLSSMAMNQPKPPLPPFILSHEPLGSAGGDADDLESPLLQGFALPIPSFGILQQGETSVSVRPLGADVAEANDQLQEWPQGASGSVGNIANLDPSGSDPWFWSVGITGGSNGNGGAANDNINGNGDIGSGINGDNKNKQINDAAAYHRNQWPPD